MVVFAACHIIFQVFPGAIKGITFIPYQMENNFKVLNIFGGEVAVALFIFFRLQDIKLFFIKPYQRLVNIKKDGNLAHGIVHLADFAFFIRHVFLISDFVRWLADRFRINNKFVVKSKIFRVSACMKNGHYKNRIIYFINPI